MGEELKTLLTPEEYASAKRTTFNAFYTSPTVIAAIHEGRRPIGDAAEAMASMSVIERVYQGPRI